MARNWNVRQAVGKPLKARQRFDRIGDIPRRCTSSAADGPVQSDRLPTIWGTGRRSEYSGLIYTPPGRWNGTNNNGFALVAVARRYRKSSRHSPSDIARGAAAPIPRWRNLRLTDILPCLQRTAVHLWQEKSIPAGFITGTVMATLNIDCGCCDHRSAVNHPLDGAHAIERVAWFLPSSSVPWSVRL